MLNCKHINNLISQYIDGEVSPRIASEINEHILSCKSCSESVERFSKAIDTLESLPNNEESIDLYAEFQMRLVNQRRIGKFKFPSISLKSWAVTGIAAVLVLIGIIGDSLIRSNRTLYISNPRSEYSSIYSSVAIAAEKAQDRPGLDTPLLEDSRLGRKIDITAKGETLGKVLETLSDRTGVNITAASDLARQRVYLRLQDMSISTIMSEIRKLSDSDWKISKNLDNRHYELICPGRVKTMASVIAEAQAMVQAERVLRKILLAIKTCSPKPIEDEAVYNSYGLGKELQKLSENHRSKIAASCAPFFLIDDEVVSTIIAGQKYHIACKDMSMKQKKYFLACNNSLYCSKTPEKNTLEIWIEYAESGEVMLNIGATESGSGSTIGFNLYDPIWHNTRNTNMLTKENITALYKSESSGNASYDDIRLKTPMHIGIVNQTNSPTYTVPQMLDLIAKRTNLQIVSDYFSVNSKQSRVFTSELDLGELLAVLEHECGIAWYITPDNILRLVHSQWPALQQTEPDMELASKLNDYIRRNGKLTIDEIAPLANLNKLQLNGITSQLDNYSISSTISSVISGNTREMLKLYSSLKPMQKLLAKSKLGVSSDSFDNLQKRIAYKAAHSTVSGMTPKALNAKYTFTVFDGKTKRKEIKAIADGMSSSVYFAGTKAEADYICFKISGEYEQFCAFSQSSK